MKDDEYFIDELDDGDDDHNGLVKTIHDDEVPQHQIQNVILIVDFFQKCGENKTLTRCNLLFSPMI